MPEPTASQAPAAFAPEPTASNIQRVPQPPPSGLQPFVAQSSVQPHSQPVHQAPPPVAYAPPIAPPAPMPHAPMFDDSQRQRSVTTDSHRAIGGSKKPILLIGGAVGAVALVVVIIFAMKSKGDPKVADKPNKPEVVEPVVKPPPDDVVAVVTPDAAETLPDDTTPPDPRPNPNTRNPNTGTPNTGNPTTGTPKNPKTGKTPKIRGTKTTPIETGKGTTAPVSTGDAGDKSEKAQAAYKLGNQKLFAGDANGAIAAYRQVIGMGSSAGYRGLGLAYAQQGDTRNAIAAFKKYLQVSPNAKDAALIKKRIAALQGK